MQMAAQRLVVLACMAIAAPAVRCAHGAAHVAAGSLAVIVGHNDQVVPADPPAIAPFDYSSILHHSGEIGQDDRYGGRLRFV